MDYFLNKNNFYFVAIGAVPASIFRWQLDDIFIVNLIGCFLLGFINALVKSRKYQLIFGFGFCGSLTSFSGWSLKLFELISQGSYGLFFFNSILVVLIGCLTVAIGHLLAIKIIANVF